MLWMWSGRPHSKGPEMPPKYKMGKGTAVQMYAVREIVHEENDPAEGQDDESATEENTGDDEDSYGGSQYSSEGEEMEFDEFHPMTYDDEDHHVVHLCNGAYPGLLLCL